MLITDLLERNAKNSPDDVSLVEINPEINEKHAIWHEFELVEAKERSYTRREMTWGQFDEKANKFANLLLKNGIGKGKKVAILLMNCLEWLPIYFGVLKTGAVVVPMNFRYTADEIKYCLDLAEVDMLVFGIEFVGRIEQIYSKISRVKQFYFVGGETPSFAENYLKLTSLEHSTKPNIKIDNSEDAAIYFSSGTTGFPKAILHSHDALYTSCETELEHHKQEKKDNFLCIPPLYHTGAKMHWFGSLLSSSKAVLLLGVKPEWILKCASEEKITIVWLLVPWAQDILDALDNGEINLQDLNLSQLRLMHIGAQPVPPSLIHRWIKYFPNHKYDTNYGLSESTGPGCVHLGIDNIQKVGAIGKAGHNWQTRIVDEKHKDVAVGSVGELAVKGPGVMKCYYHDKKATQEVLKDGWLFTGDMAKEDEDGFIHLVDRKKDVIISGGENIYPVQIEDFLRAHPAIKDVAVIGLPDKRLGEISAAIIECKSGAMCTEQEIDAFCAEMPRYKRPKKIIFDKVPRNPTGKIEKPVLREKYCGESLVATQCEN